jgi:hypothetical protein
LKKLSNAHSAIEVSSYRFRSFVKRIASNEQPRDRNSWQFALRCLPLCRLPPLIGLAGCGPASLTTHRILGRVRAWAGRPVRQGPSPRNGHSPRRRFCAPCLVKWVGGVRNRDSPRRGQSYAVPVLSSESGPSEGLVVPESMAQNLNSLNVLVRLRALEARRGKLPKGSIRSSWPSR